MCRIGESFSGTADSFEPFTERLSLSFFLIPIFGRQTMQHLRAVSRNSVTDSLILNQ